MNTDEINKDSQEAPSTEEAADETKTVPARKRRRSAKESKQADERVDEDTPDTAEREKASSRELLFLKELEKRHRDEDDDNVNIPNILPVLPLKDTVVFPFPLQPLGFGQAPPFPLIHPLMP